MDEKNEKYKIAVMILGDKMRRQGLSVDLDVLWNILHAMAKDAVIFSEVITMAAIFKIECEVDEKLEKSEQAIESMEKFLGNTEPLTEEEDSVVKRLLEND